VEKAGQRKEQAPEPAAEAAHRTEPWAAERLKQLVAKLGLWGQPVEPDGYEIGPTFVRLRVRPAGSKTTFKKIADKGVDLKIHLGLEVPPYISDQAGYIGVDIQRPNRKTISLAEALADPPRGKESEPVFPVGQDVAGKTHWLNLADTANCHLLVAGTTGSGKSEFLKAMVAALAERLGPDQVQFVFIDPKRLTFNFGQQGSPYLLRPVAYSIEEALPLVELCFEQTELRYELLQEKGLENLAELKGADAMPHIVVIIDEFADLMADKEAKKALEAPLKRIGAKARAAGIHLVLATQRPEAPGVITALLKSNLPGRICLKVAGEKDSKIILDTVEGAYLLGKGDLIWKHGGGLIRLQSPLVRKEELSRALRLGEMIPV
jgi:S-DNA-T family DNA segregation ATPase FtsK/SpoIIIE